VASLGSFPLNVLHMLTLVLVLEVASPLHKLFALQDLVKRLLQKDPNARLPFAAFFAHPFLSGQPLHNIQALPDTPEIYVEEPSSSAIEEDYVILSIPHPQPSTQQVRGTTVNEEHACRPAHSVFLNLP
jgi:hypothetical protein